jgi:hypothetical protein
MYRLIRRQPDIANATLPEAGWNAPRKSESSFGKKALPPVRSESFFNVPSLTL